MKLISKGLNALWGKDKILKVIGCHNALGAKVAEESGFDGVWFSGFEFATSHCVPDASIMTMTDNLQALSSITRAVKIPVIADCDSGFGDLNNVIHMVKEYERIGVSAVCIEDKMFPKLNSFCGESQALLNIKEFSSKIAAAVEARASKNFFIIARIESLIAGTGLDDALTRAIAYKKAGADAILIHSKAKNPEEIISFCKMLNLDIPLIIVPTTYPQFSINDIRAVSEKIKVVIYANHGIRAAIKAMKMAYENILSQGSALNVEGEICSVKEAFEYQGMAAHMDNYNRYCDLVESLTDKE